MKWNRNHLRELKQLEHILKSNLCQHRTFKRIYEGNNINEIKDKEEILINHPEVKEVIDNISFELSDYIIKKDKTLKQIFYDKRYELNVRDYIIMLETIKDIINVMEYELFKNKSI